MQTSVCWAREQSNWATKDDQTSDEIENTRHISAEIMTYTPDLANKFMKFRDVVELKVEVARRCGPR